MKFFVKTVVSDHRMTICRACDQLSEHNFCNQCGCYMPLKTKMGWADCPLKKWAQSDDHDPEQPIPENATNSNSEPSKEEIIIVP